MYYYSDSFHGDAAFESAGFFVTDESWRHASRIIDSYELIFIINGNLPMEVDGKRYKLRPNEVLIIPPDTPHKGYNDTEGEIRFIWIHLTYDGLKKVSKDEIIKHCMENQQKGRLLVLPSYHDKMDMHRLFLMANQLLDINQEGVSQSYLNTYLNSILYEISYQAIRIIKQDQITNNNMQPIQDWIRIHAFENITLRDIANYFNYNSNYLSRKYKEIMGIGIAYQITEYRISHAKFLLTNTNKTIDEISYDVGYEDPKYFMRVFKQMENNTPSKYRKAFNQRHFNKK